MHWDGGAKRQGRATPTTPAVVSFHLMTVNERFIMMGIPIQVVTCQVVIIIIMIMMPITPQSPLVH